MSTRHPEHPNWTTVGDVDYVDEDGYLYLIDHPSIADVAVFGLPNEEMGEEVKAVVELRQCTRASPELAEEIRASLAGYKVPRSVDFVDRLPRLGTGKLYKKALRDTYLREEGAVS